MSDIILKEIFNYGVPVQWCARLDQYCWARDPGPQRKNLRRLPAIPTYPGTVATSRLEFALLVDTNFSISATPLEMSKFLEKSVVVEFQSSSALCSIITQRCASSNATLGLTQLIHATMSARRDSAKSTLPMKSPKCRWKSCFFDKQQNLKLYRWRSTSLWMLSSCIDSLCRSASVDELQFLAANPIDSGTTQENSN